MHGNQFDIFSEMYLHAVGKYPPSRCCYSEPPGKKKKIIRLTNLSNTCRCHSPLSSKAVSGSLASIFPAVRRFFRGVPETKLGISYYAPRRPFEKGSRNPPQLYYSIAI